MRYKRIINLFFFRIIWYFKNLKIICFFQLILADIIFPLIILFCYNKYSLGDFYNVNSFLYALFLLPLTSILMVVFIIKIYIEDDGSELLLVSKEKANILDLVFIFNAFFVHYLPIECFSIIFMKLDWYLFVIVYLISVMLFGLTYIIAQLTKSISITIMIDILYIIFGLLLCNKSKVFPFPFLFYNMHSINSFSYYIIIGFLGSLLIYLGNFCCKKHLTLR